MMKALHTVSGLVLVVLVGVIVAGTTGDSLPRWSLDPVLNQSDAAAAATAGGRLVDPTTIPKYVIPLVVPSGDEQRRRS